MHQDLTSILSCPKCQGEVILAECHQSSATRVLEGDLQCNGCGQQYPIKHGIPRLVEAAEDVRTTGKRFDFEWVSRWLGRFENKRLCHGLELQPYVQWMVDQLGAHTSLRHGDRIIDAGCGSGEKTSLLAKRCPDQRIIGLDLGIGALEKASHQFGDIDNLDYVQGSILHPPFKKNSFRWGISIGVLHHTPSTEEALAQFLGLLTTDASILLWLYRPFWEAPEWRLPYFVRDVLCLGQSPKCSPEVLLTLSFGLVGLTFPMSQCWWWLYGKRMNKDLPFLNPRTMSLRESFSAQVFHLFDTLLPRFQFRHKVSEVKSWCLAKELKLIFHAHGFYLATSGN